MKTLIASALTASMFVAGVASAETLAEKTGINSTLGVAPSAADFVTEAAQSDMFEIQSSKIAEQRATDDATKNFATKMIDDHTKTTGELKPLALQAHLNVPSSLDSTHQKMLDQLASLKGPDFLKHYHDDQVTGHKEAVALFERYAKGGKNEEIKSFAAKTLLVIQGHLKMAQDLDKSSS